VSTLILIISLHFVGDPSHLKDKNTELLSNLQCKKLSDFQWYKNTFLTRVMLREDSNQAFWKEKFLAGLPILLEEKKVIPPSFKLERGTPKLVINYKPLNFALKWIRYPIPNKKDLLQKLHSAFIFSKFDMKSGFWQIQIAPKIRYKTAFTVPFGQYELNVMPFGLKYAPSEFQRIMNDIFNAHSKFCIVYIDDVLIFSHSINQHFKHLHAFFHTAKQNGLVVSKTKISLFQTRVRFLGHYICQGTVTPIQRSLTFTNKFS
jgi:hypothetical protein